MKAAPYRRRWVVRRITHDRNGDDYYPGHPTVAWCEESMTEAVRRVLKQAYPFEGVEVAIEDHPPVPVR